MTEETLTRVRGLLLEELKSDAPRKWYYLSIRMNDETFAGCFLHAHGPTDAWLIMHRLAIYPYAKAKDTQTMELADEEMKKVPEDLRWRFATVAEIEAATKTVVVQGG